MDTKQLTVGYVGNYVKFLPKKGKQNEIVLDKYGKVYFYEINVGWSQLVVSKIFYFYNECKDELLKVNTCKRSMRPTHPIGKTGLFFDVFTKLLYKKCKGHYHKIAKTGHLPAVSHYTYVEEYSMFQYTHLGDVFILDPNSQINNNEIKNHGNGILDIDLTDSESRVLSYDAIDIKDHTKSIRVNEIFGVLTQREYLEQGNLQLYTDGYVKNASSGRGMSIPTQGPPDQRFLQVGIPASFQGNLHIHIYYITKSGGTIYIIIRRASSGNIPETLLEFTETVNSAGSYQFSKTVDTNVEFGDLLMMETSLVDTNTQEQLEHRVETILYPVSPAIVVFNSGPMPIYDHIFGFGKAFLKNDQNLKTQILEVGVTGGPGYRLNRMNYTFTNLSINSTNNSLPEGQVVNISIFAYGTNNAPGTLVVSLGTFQIQTLSTQGAIKGFELTNINVPRGYTIALITRMITQDGFLVDHKAVISISGERF